MSQLTQRLTHQKAREKYKERKKDLGILKRQIDKAFYIYEILKTESCYKTRESFINRFFR